MTESVVLRETDLPRVVAGSGQREPRPLGVVPIGELRDVNLMLGLAENHGLVGVHLGH